MDYLDFELEIQPGAGREYPVAVLRSPAGEARATMHFPFDQLALESRLDKLQIALLRSGGKRRSVLSAEEKAVQEFGQALFEAAFTGEVRNRYDVSCERAAQKEQGVRLKLRIQAPELAALPWEFLYDPRQAEYLCLSRNTPLVRYLELPQRVQSLKVTPPLRILGMMTSPCDQVSLDVTREKQRIERAVAGLRAQGLVELTWLDGQTWRDLQRAMRGGPWHIFHFVGHGGYDPNLDEGLVVLADEDGRSETMSATQLARLLADHRSLRLVVLNTCEGARGGRLDVFSSTASILLRCGIPAVIAMQYEITDLAAIEFGRAFYEALADGLPADAAASEARKAVSLEVANTIEWGTPVLHMRTPDGVLFDMAALPSPIGPIAVPEEPPVQASAAAEPPAPTRIEPAPVSEQPLSGSLTSEAAPIVRPAPERRSEPRSRRLWQALVGWLGLLAVLVFVLIKVNTRGGPEGPPALTSTVQAQAAMTAGALVILPPTAAPVSIAAITSTPSPPAIAQITPESGATIVSPVDGMVMVWVPAGEFTMGSADTDTEANSDEKPQHRVYVEGFWISRTEVTNAQYTNCVKAGACTAPDKKGDNRAEGAAQPVTYASWYDANAYAAWAGGRLPTEAEWEKACRGADGQIYPWGDAEPTDKLARYGVVTSARDVGSYPDGASPYGLLDMAGNVWEWTSSEPRDYPYRVDDGREGPDAKVRALRGGAFDFSAGYVRCAVRFGYDPDNRNGDAGFRVVASPIMHDSGQ